MFEDIFCIKRSKKVKVYYNVSDNFDPFVDCQYILCISLDGKWVYGDTDDRIYSDDIVEPIHKELLNYGISLDRQQEGTFEVTYIRENVPKLGKKDLKRICEKHNLVWFDLP